MEAPYRKDIAVTVEELDVREFSLLRVTQLRRLEPALEPLSFSDSCIAEMR